MAGKAVPPRRIALRLLHDGVQPGPPLAEKLSFGLQDNKGEVHPPVGKQFDFTLDVRGESGVGAPVFAGTFAHGPPAARFIYLSWKRGGNHDAPWGWRIKIPLAGISWQEIETAERQGSCIEADVTGRRPHVTAPVAWRAGKRRRA